MKAHFQMFAGYNAWANGRLYAASAELSEADYRADLGAYFKSVEGTLNHLMIGDLLWIARFRGQAMPKLPLTDILHDNLPDLTAARKVLDADIVRLIDEMPPDRFGKSFTYRAMTLPGEQSQVLAEALSHFFNHQTHHRGQVHALLSRLGLKAPPLDLLYYQRGSVPEAG
ncbi:MAG: DinB family protein [Pseudomonadota bacterium]